MFVPTISQFYGITIRMYVNDHNPPHFHAQYGGDEAYVDLKTGEVFKGRLPRSAVRLVRRWALARQAELMDNWNLSKIGKVPQRILGLDAD
ncbi:MAG TPA: DUF4160 domain-containing protein [Rhizomicrobium sp.]|nr:DUF4160 domain-containing protein [Rhizomicrobium sp.]